MFFIEINFIFWSIMLSHFLFLQVYYQKIQFAPIGLIRMYNSGGAVEALGYVGDQLDCKIQIEGGVVGSLLHFPAWNQELAT